MSTPPEEGRERCNAPTPNHDELHENLTSPGRQAEPGNPSLEQSISVLETLFSRCDLWAKWFPSDKPRGEYRPQREPLTRDILEAHLKGNLVCGSYTTDPATQSCRFAVVDVDAHDGEDPEANFEFSKAVVLTFEQAGARATLEDSNGAGGYHVWIVFDESIPAAALRRWALPLLESIPGKLPFEFFPKQDRVESGGAGNLVRLPGVHPVNGTRSRFWLGEDEWTEDLTDETLFEETDAAIIPPLPVEPEADSEANDSNAPGFAGSGDSPEALGRVEKALWLLKADRCDSYGDWLKIGMILHREDPSERGLALWRAWSEQSPKHNPGDCESKWPSFRADRSFAVGLGSLFAMAREDDPEGARALIEKPDAVLAISKKKSPKLFDPLEEARALIASRFTSERGRPTLRRWNEGWFQYDPEAAHYKPKGIDFLRRAVWLHLGERIDRPNGRMRDDLVSSLLHVDGVLIDSEEDAPVFLDGESGPSREDGIDVSNGVLDSRNRTVHPASESLFRLSAPSFGHDPEAGEPARFNQFLEEIGFDESERSVLFEWFGLCLTRDTSYQKIMFLEGPPRSGKSTLIRILERLLGPGESAAMTPQAFSERFGLSPLIGKRAGFIADGKWPHPLPQPMTARLLGISGEDTQLTEAKYAPARSIRLGARITLVSNEPLPLDSGLENLRSRIIRLETKTSFLGREDSRLIRELEAELPAIFNQALDGLDRLRKRGRFPKGFEIPRRAGEADLGEWIIEQARPCTESEIHRSGPGGFRNNRDATRAGCSKLIESGRFGWVDILPPKGGPRTRGIVFLGDGGLSSAEVVCEGVGHV